MQLSEAKSGDTGYISSITGSHHLLSRLIGIGIVEGSRIRVIQNRKNQPVLFYCRDSVIALSKHDCSRIYIEEVLK